MALIRNGLLAAAFAFSASVAQADSMDPECPTTAPDAGLSFPLREEPTPGISWTVWSDLLQVRWTKEQIASSAWFDRNAMAKAVAEVGGDGVPLEKEITIGREVYTPLQHPENEQDSRDYLEAARSYDEKTSSGFSAAIDLFDKIAQRPGSPYRAAAAYSAARAAFYLGQWDEGFRRVENIAADPQLREFHFATYHLIGTLAYQLGTPPLVAARLTEISHLLMAPLALRCRDAQLRDLTREAGQDLSYILRLTYPKDRFEDSGWGPRTRAIFDKLGDIDPVLDLIRVLAAPTPFRQDSGWIDGVPPQAGDLASFVDPDAAAVSIAKQGADDLTDHARKRLVATGNPLWAYALATRTQSADDIALIHQTRAKLHVEWAAGLTDEVVATLRAQFLAQEARLLLMAGRMDEAMALLKQNDLPSYLPKFPSWGGQSPRSIAVNGGLRYLLARHDLEGARKWAASMREIFPKQGMESDPIDPRLALLVATSWDDLGKLDWKNSSLEVFDLLPADRLIALSRRADLPLTVRRAVLSAGWVRLYMLNRWPEFKALFPEVREKFPELAADIDAIGKSWTDTQRHHLVTRMLLRSPGLSPRVSWDRSQAFNYRMPNDPSIFRIDSDDPNDRNWWCPLDVKRAEFDVMGVVFSGPIDPRSGQFFDAHAFSGGAWFVDQATRDRMAAKARELIAWHPLLRDADFKELEALSKSENGPSRLTHEALAWADGSNFFTRYFGWDDSLPETLHLAVRSTRYGCRLAGGHGTYSRAAYEALRKRYPNSEWTTKTPYWFDTPVRSE